MDFNEHMELAKKKRKDKTFKGTPIQETILFLQNWHKKKSFACESYNLESLFQTYVKHTCECYKPTSIDVSQFPKISFTNDNNETQTIELS